MDPTELLITRLKEENARLMAQLKAFTEGGNFDMSAFLAAQGGGGGDGMGASGAPMTEEEKQALKRQLQEEMANEIASNQKMLEDQARSWEDRYKASESLFSEADLRAREEEEKRGKFPHMRNISEDPALSHMITRFLDSPVTTIGRKDALPPPDIVLGGLSIQKEHAKIVNEEVHHSNNPDTPTYLSIYLSKYI